jgi:hypothetical protein
MVYFYPLSTEFFGRMRGHGKIENWAEFSALEMAIGRMIMYDVFK